MLDWLKEKLTMRRYRKRWRQVNAHNATTPMGCYPMDKITIGRGTYGPIDALFSNHVNRLVIGSYCSVAGGVKFLVSGDHALDRISTFPFQTRCLTGEWEALSKGDIVVADDVWIGYGATILSGVRIGQGAVVAAGAVVSKDVPPYAVAAGIPAKVIKFRFAPDMIEELMKIDYSRLDETMIREHREELYQKLEHKEQLFWLPRKSDCGGRMHG